MKSEVELAMVDGKVSEGLLDRVLEQICGSFDQGNRCVRVLGKGFLQEC